LHCDGGDPVWAKDATSGYSTINAMAETVATMRAFRDAFKSRRCQQGDPSPNMNQQHGQCE